MSNLEISDISLLNKLTSILVHLSTSIMFVESMRNGELGLQFRHELREYEARITDVFIKTVVNPEEFLDGDEGDDLITRLFEQSIPLAESEHYGKMQPQLEKQVRELRHSCKLLLNSVDDPEKSGNMFNEVGRTFFLHTSALIPVILEVQHRLFLPEPPRLDEGSSIDLMLESFMNCIRERLTTRSGFSDDTKESRNAILQNNLRLLQYLKKVYQ